MASFRWLPSLGSIVAEFRKTVFRFPLPLACALGFCLVSIADNHGMDQLFAAADKDGRLRIFLFLGFFASLAVNLFTEKQGIKRLGSLCLALVGLVLVALRVYSSPAWENVWFEGYLLFLGPALVLLVVAARFIRTPHDAAGFWDFNRAAWQGAVFAFLIALVLALGLSAALMAIETLFGVKFSGKLFGDIWALCLSVLWPWQALAVVPEGLEEPEAPNCPKLLARLISYILAPLSLVYLAILYAYGAKILFEWELPEGEVASLVAVYATFGVAVHLIAYPLRGSGPRFVALFHRWFYPALLVPVALLALAVWLRIDAYGVTEQRYMLTVFTLWLAGMALWLWRRPDRNLVLVPLSLALLLMAASFGPWGAVGFSTTSQMARLETLLTKHGRLRDARIVPSERAVDWDDRKAISSIVDYFWSTGKLGALRPWFAAAGLELDKSLGSRAAVAAMGLEYVAGWKSRSHFSFNGNNLEQVSVSGFDTLVDWTVWHGLQRSTTVRTDRRRYEIVLDADTKELTVLDDLGRTVTFDLMALARRLKDSEDRGDPTDLMTLEKSAEGLRVRLHANQLGGQIVGGEPEVDSFGGLILIGERPG